MKPRRRDATSSRQIMTVAEVAQYLHIHPSTVYKLIRQGQIPVFKMGSDYRFYKDVVDKWMTDRQVKVRN